jgi:hypothetical protein
MTNEQQLIDLCERLEWALDINFLRGTVTMRGKRFASIAAALAEAQRVANAIKNFGK